MGCKKLVVFDFDGTLTTCDSFVKFAQSSVGIARLVRAVVSNILCLAAWKCRIVAGGYAKEKLFASLYAGYTYEWLVSQGKDFAPKLLELERHCTVKALDGHISHGDLVYIVSASLPEWIIPWASQHSVPQDHVIGTLCEVDGRGMITGRFASPNCYGAQKVLRLIQSVGNLSDYHITVYGDSKGDDEMFDVADVRIRIKP